MIIEYLIYNSKHDHKKNNFESIFPGQDWKIIGTYFLWGNIPTTLPDSTLNES